MATVNLPPVTRLDIKMMVVYYLVLTAYSFVAVVTTVPTWDFSYGELWGWLGPFLMLIASVLALVGLRRTLRRKKGLEIVMTLLLIGLLTGYAVAILARALITNRWDIVAGTFLPVLIIVPMYFRLLQIFPTLPDWMWDKLPRWLRRR